MASSGKSRALRRVASTAVVVVWTQVVKQINVDDLAKKLADSSDQVLRKARGTIDGGNYQLEVKLKSIAKTVVDAGSGNLVSGDLVEMWKGQLTRLEMSRRLLAEAGGKDARAKMKELNAKADKLRDEVFNAINEEQQ